MTARGQTCLESGFTLVEVLVAIGIAATVGLALTQQLAMAHRARRTGMRIMRASRIATERMEHIRSGGTAGPAGLRAGFDCRWSSEPVPGHTELQRVSVTVTWDDGGPQQFTLEALLPGAP